jgi:hypothetical protein
MLSKRTARTDHGGAGCDLPDGFLPNLTNIKTGELSIEMEITRIPKNLSRSSTYVMGKGRCRGATLECGCEGDHAVG